MYALFFCCEQKENTLRDYTSTDNFCTSAFNRPSLNKVGKRCGWDFFQLQNKGLYQDDILFLGVEFGENRIKLN